MSYTVRVLLRVALTFITLLALARITGKKQLSQSTFFDFITAITIGDIAGEHLANPDSPLLPWLAGTVFWFAMTVGLDLAVIRSRSLAHLVEGRPSVLVENGQIVQKNLKANFLRIDEMLADFRKKGHFNPSDIAYAMFEIDGHVSVQTKPGGLTHTVVADGRIRHEELQKAGQSEDWLRQELQARGFADPKEVFLAVVDPNGKLTVDGKE